MQSETNSASQGVISFIGLIVFCLLIGSCLNSGSSTGSNDTPQHSASSTDVPRMRWDTVAETFEKGGAPYTSVEPYDPKYPNTMRVIISGSVARDMTDYDARKLAKTAWERMGENAIIYIKDDTGKTLAKATSWGVGNP